MQRLPYLFFLISCRNNDGDQRNVASQIARRIFKILCATVSSRNLNSPECNKAKNNRCENQLNRLTLLISKCGLAFERRFGE